MAEHNELGKFGEAQAVEYLQQNGYTILETNWTFQKAEIDIIAQKENTLVIIEVKNPFVNRFWFATGFCKTKENSIIGESRQ